MNENGHFISIEEAQQILRVGARQVHKHLASGKIRSVKEGKRRLIIAEDVHRLAEELGSIHRKLPQPAVEMLPDSGPLIDYIRELHGQVALLSRRIGELEAQVQVRLLPEAVEDLRQELADAKAQAHVYAEETERAKRDLQAMIQQERKPWWKRLLK